MLEVFSKKMLAYGKLLKSEEGISRYSVNSGNLLNTHSIDITNSFDGMISVEDKALFRAFQGCTGLTGTLSFPDLVSIGEEGMEETFLGCTGLTGKVYFPKLKTLGWRGLYRTFANCTGITEIHFRSDVETTYIVCDAPNATVFYDL